MTEVAFHFNAPDKQAYACRLLRKAFLKGARVVVLADGHAVAPLDAALWTFGAEEFLPHSAPGDEPHVMAHSPIHLCSEVPASNPGHRSMVLVNLRAVLPDRFAEFGRVIEVVSTDPVDRDGARQRWMHYRAAGIEPQRHDLKLASAE